MKVSSVRTSYFGRDKQDGPFDNAQRGQALLIVILVMVVALTVGLSAATRSITNTRIATEEESSQRAFAAAEAGIEQSLKSNLSIGSYQTLTDNNARYKTNVSFKSEPSFPLNNDTLIKKDEGFDIWLSKYNGNVTPHYTGPFWSGNLTLYWGETTEPCDEAAIEVIVITTISNPQVRHYVYDECTSRSGGPNNFSTGAEPTSFKIANHTYRYKITFPENLDTPPTITGGIIARVVPLYKDAYIGVSGDNLPAQGATVVAEGNSGETVRKVKAFKPYPSVPNEFFQYLLLEN